MGLLSGIKAVGSNLLTAGKSAVGSAIADQWKEYFYCDSLANDVLMVKGQKRITSKGANSVGSDNIITSGSGIVVNDGQCMIIVEQGKIVEVCAEPGQFTYDASTEPSIFSGKLGTSIVETFKTIGKRFTYGGETAKDQRVYYFNIKEIMDNKFGTQTPIMFRVVDSKINLDTDIQIRCSGTYTFTIANPLMFYSKVAGNIQDTYKKDLLTTQMKSEFVSALQPAFGALSELEIRPSGVPNHVKELRDAVNAELADTWLENRGISCSNINLNPISLTEEDQKKITDAQFEARYTNVNQAAAGLAAAQMQAMKDAANNSAGAMTGFMGMGFAQQQGGGINAASLYQMGQQQAQQAAPAAPTAPAAPAATPAAPQAGEWTCPECGTVVTGNFCTNCGAKKVEAPAGWTCECGNVNTGNFCSNCGKKKPEPKANFKCDKCGWTPEDPTNPPKFCPNCGDPFNDADKV